MENQHLGIEDVLKLVEEQDMKILNLCHIPEDCRLKTLSFAVKDKERLHEALKYGERVDGSSLFSYLAAHEGDIYIKPRTETAFSNPFSSIPTLNILCQYLDQKGTPWDFAPQTILLKAEEKLHNSTGVTLRALAELEFYIIHPEEHTSIPEVTGNNYHESPPFVRFENLRNEALLILEKLGLTPKYGHAEVGRFQSKSGHWMEQHEIEFLPQNLSRMADTVTIAKWVIRNLCPKYEVSVSFAPKLALNQPGNGMHIHLCALRNNKNIIADSKGKMTSEAKQIIGGILKLAPSLTAFGNTIPPSYLRFISRTEAPMHICWGERDRLALIRIPLWWSFRKDINKIPDCKRTLEFRGPDPTANIHLLLAGIALAVEYGLKNPQKSTAIAEDLNTETSVGKGKKFATLPSSCSESAENLRKDRKYYQSDGVFPSTVIDNTIKKLQSYQDSKLWTKLNDKPEKIEELAWKYLHSG